LLIHQYVSPDNGIERSIERHFRWIALHKGNVRPRQFPCSIGRCGDYRGCEICSNNLTSWTYQVRNQKGNVAHAAAHIKDTHARHDSGLKKESLCYRCQEARLHGDAL